MAAKITTVFWDLDGTLIDSEDIHNESAIYAAQLLGCPCNLINFPAGLENTSTFELIFGKQITDDNLALFLEWEQLAIEYTIKRICREQQITPAVDLFRQLAKLGIAQSVISNSPKIIVEHSLSTLGLRDLCHGIFSRDMVKHGKPDPQLYLDAIQFHQETPDKCLVFEDSATGITAAKRAGITNIIGVGEDSTKYQPSLVCSKEDSNWFMLIQPLIT